MKPGSRKHHGFEYGHPAESVAAAALMSRQSWFQRADAGGNGREAESPRKLWWFLTFVLTLLLAGDVYLVYSRWQEDMARTLSWARGEMDLLAWLVQGELRRGEFPGAARLLRDWGRKEPEVAALSLFAANGDAIGIYRRANPPERSLALTRTVSYGDRDEAKLALALDLAPIEAHRFRLIIELGSAYLMLASLLILLTRTLSLRRREAYALRARTDELDRAHTALKAQVAQRQRAEGERNRLIAVLEGTTDLVALSDLNGNLTYLNRAGRDLLGLGDRPLDGLRIQDIHPDRLGRSITEAAIPTAIQEGVWSGETALLGVGAKEIPVSELILGHRDPRGEVAFLSTIVRDISRRLAAERIVNRHNQLLRALARVNAVSVQSGDDERLMKEVCRVLAEEGWFRMAWVGLVEADGVVVRPVACAGFEAGYLQAIEVRCDESPTGLGPVGSCIRWGQTVIIRFHDSDARFAPWREQALARGYLSSSATPIRKNGVIIGAIAVYSAEADAFGEEDVVLLEQLASQLGHTLEHQQAEIELLRYRDHLEDLVAERTRELAVLNQELESFSYSVSHDLRGPLRGIDGFSQALLEDCGDQLDETGKNYLQRVRNGVQRMSELIDDLLELARVTRSRMTPGEVDLSAMAREILNQLQHTQPERRVEMAVAPGLIVRGDRRLLRLALENLLGNAWKYTGKQAQARIEFGRESADGNPVFFVRDNGAGFDMQYAHKLFAPFQRLHHPSEFEGTGIGLATIQRIIHRHGGRIWAEAEPGKGAIFRFVLGASASLARAIR
jgi:PAS domain S-box-containing protein